MKKLIAVGLIAILSINFYPANVAKDDVNDLLPYFNWRDVDGVDYTTPIKNQEPCPSCEAYALVAAVETLVQYEVGHPFGCDLSEAHLFFCSGGTCKRGVNVTRAAEYLVEYGVPDEGCFPDPHRKSDTPCNYTMPGWENRTVKIEEWGWVENDIEEIKKALIEHGPLIICIWIWKDFMYYRGGVYRHKWGRLEGGHLVALVGYDDNQQCWICKNSWGENWGEKGWFKIAYDADMFIAGCYGGTGILYVDGVCGTFTPDVPKVYIDEPRRYHTYFFGLGFPSIFGRFIRVGIPRIIGWTNVRVNATNTNKVEFYMDEQLKFIDEDPPFEWRLDAPFGFHTVEAMAYNEGNASKAIIDVFVIS
jgi:hypothetical protein